MRAAVLYDVARMEIRDVARAGRRAARRRRAVAAVGLCGTDFHIFDGHGNYHTDEHGRRIPLAEHAADPRPRGRGGVVEAGARRCAACRAGDRVVHRSGAQLRQRRRAPRCASTAPAATRTSASTTASTASPDCRAGSPRPGRAGGQRGAARRHALPRRRRRSPSRSPASCMRIDAAVRAPAHATASTDRRRRARADRARHRRRARPACSSCSTCAACSASTAGCSSASPTPVKRALAARSAPRPSIRATEDLVDAVLDAHRRAAAPTGSSTPPGRRGCCVDLPGVMRKQATVVLYGHGHAGVDISVISNIQFREPTLVDAGRRLGRLRRRRPAGRLSRVRSACSRRGASRVDAVHHAPLSLARRRPAAFAGEHRRPATSRASSSC